MRKLFVAVMAVLMMGSTGVLADEFAHSSPYDFYAGGYTTNTRSHWTQHDINGNVTVGSGIKVESNPTEVNHGLRNSRINSSHDAGPYASHTHYSYNF